MSARTDVLLWARRVVARKDAPAHQILEIAAGCDLAAAQEAFHKIARVAHPDLHRTTLASDELELVTAAYARAAAAYQEIRTQKMPSGRMRPIQGLGSNPALVPPSTGGPPTPTSLTPSKPLTPPPLVPSVDDQPINPAQAMSAKALLHYRKAELGLRRGDLTGAVLQLKMAIASDPQSQFLRTALAEVESEVSKKP
jgi:hypothetical protein